MPFAGSTVVLAGVTMISERMSVLRVGAETVGGSETEAVVAAVLDAVRKPIQPVTRPGVARSDRQKQFEGLRQQYERLIRTDAIVPSPAAQDVVGPPGSAPSEPTPSEPAPPEPEGGPGWDDSSRPQAAVATAAPPVTAPVVAGPPVTAPPTAALSPQDVIHDLSEIRPEREGGALVMREEIRHEGPLAKAAPRLSVEDAFYRRLVTTGVPVHIRCRDGYEIPTATIRDFGTYSLMVEVNGVMELVFKHGIISIRPYGPLPPESMPPS